MVASDLDDLPFSTRQRRRSLFANLFVLIAGAAALFGFIAVTADVRRVGNAMRQARSQAEHYAARLQGTNSLPLNLEPTTPDTHDPRLLEFEWTSSDEAYDLRRSREPVMAAWTTPVFRLFGRDGRAVVFFHAGRFDAKWLGLAEFESVVSVQRSELSRLRQP